MKYSQASQVKAIVDKGIVSLEKTIQEGRATAAGKRQLATAYTSGIRIVVDMFQLMP